MAIDDNTSYELTGRQVKDSANKVKAKADSASLASVATSGLYSDLTGAPTIPTVYNGKLTITMNGANAGEFTANQSTDTTIALTSGPSYTAGNGINIANDEISIDNTVVAEVSDLPTNFTGATSSAAGSNGLVPAPAAGGNEKFLTGNGAWTALAQTVSNSNGSCIKFADGTMIATVKYTFTTEINGAWGNCFESPCLTPPNFAAKFHSVPVCTASLFDLSKQCYIGMGSGKNSVTGSFAPTVDRPQKFVLSKPTSEPSASYTVCFIAIGRWKA